MKNKRLTQEQFSTLVRIFVTFVLIYFAVGVCMAETIKVAVIDTGYDFKSTWSNSTLDKPKLCPEGHKSYVNGLEDNHGHGTHIAGLIAQGNKNTDYCLVIIKYFDPLVKSDNMWNTLQAFKYAVDIGATIINYSGGGTDKSLSECSIINYAIGRGVKVVAAAGNEYSDLSKNPYFPAMCSDKIYKVWATTGIRTLNRLSASNYTTKPIANLFHELGYNVLSLLPNNRTGTMSGTSQATAIFTSKLVRELQYDYDKMIKLSRTA